LEIRSGNGPRRRDTDFKKKTGRGGVLGGGGGPLIQGDERGHYPDLRAKVGGKTKLD